MGGLLAWLSGLLEGAWGVAMAASALWGMLSVVLSPCHLAAIPLIVAFISGQGAVSVRRAAAISSVFALGILATIAVVGAITAAAGTILGSTGGWANYLVGAILIYVGLHLVSAVPMPSWSPTRPVPSGKGLWAAMAMGLVFGLAVGPCTFAYMAPMLAVAFGASTSSPLHGGGLLLAFGLGHCLVIALAGASTGAVQKCLHWHERSAAGAVLRRACGVLVILGGLAMLYMA